MSLLIKLNSIFRRFTKQKPGSFKLFIYCRKDHIDVFFIVLIECVIRAMTKNPNFFKHFLSSDFS